MFAVQFKLDVDKLKKADDKRKDKDKKEATDVGDAKKADTEGDDS